MKIEKSKRAIRKEQRQAAVDKVKAKGSPTNKDLAELLIANLEAAEELLEELRRRPTGELNYST